MRSGRCRSGHRAIAPTVQRRDRSLRLVGTQAASLNSTLDHLRSDAVAILRAAVTAVEPFALTRAALARTLPPHTRIHLVAAGKAAWPMAQGAIATLGTRIVGGVVSAPAGSGTLPAQLEWIGGGHPLPDVHSVRAARLAMDRAAAAARNDELLLVLLSGGGSAMLSLPPAGVSIDEKRAVIEALSHAGAPIDEINCVRKHLSSIKGGRLAAAYGGRTLTLAISDVHIPQDDPATIASGPTVGDPTTYADAVRVLERIGDVPRSVRDHLARGAAGDIPETPKPGDPRLARSEFHVIANRRTAMDGAIREATQRGYAVDVIERAMHGEAAAAGSEFVDAALSGGAFAGMRCVIAAGETTVTVRGKGRGGRNQEFALGAAKSLARPSQVGLVASLGTDGIDGPTDAAGAIVTSATVGLASTWGVDLDEVLSRNDAYAVLDKLDSLIKWGPTFTNVGDVHVLLTAGS